MLVQEKIIETVMSHGKEGKDYVITLKSLSHKEIKHSQNRIDKLIQIQLPKVSMKDVSDDISIGLLKNIRTEKNNNEIKLIISLRRPMRYELQWSNEHTLRIVLRNIMRISSILPKDQRILDFHNKILNIDLHNDLLFQLFSRNISLSKEYPNTECDLPKLTRGGVKALFFSVWVPDYFMKDPKKVHLKSPLFRRFKQYKGEPYQMALDLINRLVDEVKKTPEIEMAYSTEDILRQFKQGKKSALMGLEGAHPLEGDVSRLKTLYDKGVRYIGITWSNSNSFSDAAGYDENGGLTSLGKEFILEIMKLGIMIDVSHISDKGFYDIFKITGKKYPIIATHSTSRTLKDHKRNLTDDMIRRIHESDGVIGVVYHSGFLTNKTRASIEDVLNHIDYLVEKSSIDHVSLGSDFDGFIKTPVGLENLSKLPNLTIGLYNRGYSLEDIEKILGSNVLRVFRKVENLRQK